MEEPDFDDLDEIEEPEEDNQPPDGYECSCCGHVQSHKFGGCDKCWANALDPIFY